MANFSDLSDLSGMSDTENVMYLPDSKEKGNEVLEFIKTLSEEQC